MKILYRWVREFVDVDLSAAQAADRLTNAGVEVAGVTPLKPAQLAGVVVGEIEAIERELGESQGHRLVLCRVTTGGERFSVVGGAPNIARGVRAAFAPPGAMLPPGPGQTASRPVATVKIRGVESQGMLCSERELGLGVEHEAGILTLDADAPLGADLVAHLGLDDDVLEVEVTPNRPDCLSVVGVARELAALTGGRFHAPTTAVKESDEPVEQWARVHVDAPDLCHRFTARVVSGVRVRPAPAWLVTRLRAVGLRPISNVVDATNYVMWELGHPLHAFDHARVVEGTIVVRRARPGERFTTLDGQERGLDERMLVIADPERAIGIAGVMGGANTEVSEETTRILLESAYFLPASVRRTSRALGLPTDAAYRFERGADIEALVDASDRAAQLIAELNGGTVARGMVDAYPRPRPRPRVRLRPARIARLLGTAPPRAEAERILTGLGLSVREQGDDLDVEVPSFRRDLTMEDDLVEEVIRVWGYDKIPSTLMSGPLRSVELPAALQQAETVRRALVGAGLSEVVTYSFSDPAYDEVLRTPAAPRPIALRNPLSRDASLLRYNPLEGVLGVVATNVRKQQGSVRVFEIGKVFEPVLGLPREPRWLSIALAGARVPFGWWARPGGDARGEQVDVYDAKGLAEHVLEALGVSAPESRPILAGGVKGFEPDCHGILVAQNGVTVAEFGEVAADLRALYDVAVPVFAAALALDEVLRLIPPSVTYRPLPRFPAVQRDLAFLVGSLRAVTAAEIEAFIRKEAGPLLRQLALFDVFTFEDGRRNLAWRLTLQADDRTLTDDEANQIQERVARRVAERFNISWRGV
ncbi:MAG: phenylalanine--tRNA ligase subunit beta [Candidatus Rokuibacteriota bacterium]